MTDQKKIDVPEQSIALDSPQKLAEFSEILKKFIVQQKLYTKIQQKNYVNIEGWQFAGAAIGVMPVVKSVTLLDSLDGEIRYRAEVELRRVTNDQVVGYGVAVCSNKEGKRKGADEYVIASMAQTRATGKAYRNAFSWLMKMAGYQPTPAEEMPEEESAEQADSADVKPAKTAAEIMAKASTIASERSAEAPTTKEEHAAELN